jgi:hypothetical protein
MLFGKFSEETHWIFNANHTKQTNRYDAPCSLLYPTLCLHAPIVITPPKYNRQAAATPP